MERCGFAAKGTVRDGRKPPLAHANAYFTGFGNSKRVVFFDTLLRQLSPGVVEAVLAHELGHFKHKHISKRMVLMFGVSLLGFALLGWLSQQLWFYTGLRSLCAAGPNIGVAAENNAWPCCCSCWRCRAFSFFVTPLMSAMSRRDEFEADARATQQADGATTGFGTAQALRGQCLHTHARPMVCELYYSHPPAVDRLARMPAPAAACNTTTNLVT